MSSLSYILLAFMWSCLNSMQANEMRLTSAQLKYLNSNTLHRNALTWSGYYWPNSTLVYSVGKGMAFADYLLVMNAMADISAKTCIKFRRTHNPKEPQVNLQRTDDGCWSHIGYLGEWQTLNLGKGCMQRGIIQHELLHSLALLHMQNDPRRDRYVRINLANIEEGEQHNFQIYHSDDFQLGYDYASLMHYGAYAFSKNEKPTIVPLKRGVKIGQRIGLSAKDVLKLRIMYC
ncbi:zinc metalloproteinase nas-13 [Drosophila sulfurigaster albostrigata]|uniref:zinc metalloproteinase nas-13 n=1 Tax=Drosophila sulfurigaster albostrigata TaxID=89887 RepID=UPI002D21AEA3|nr:zinc metalloproteinase nas-13 [Drosophila sulfurigaster albostrigata]